MIRKNKIINKMFVVIGSDGKLYTVTESTEILDDSSFGEPEKYLVGIKWYSLRYVSKSSLAKNPLPAYPHRHLLPAISALPGLIRLTTKSGRSEHKLRACPK